MATAEYIESYSRLADALQQPVGSDIKWPEDDFVVDVTADFYDQMPEVRATVREAPWSYWIPAGYAGATAGSFARLTTLHPATDLDDQFVALAHVGGKLAVLARAAPREPGTTYWHPRPRTFDRLFELISTTVRTPQGSAAVGGPALMAHEIKRLSGLSDRQVAEIFPGGLARETFSRWLSGAATNPTSVNLRRLTMLRRLFRDLATRAVQPRNWLLTPFRDSTRSPYDLLVAGRLSDVEQSVGSLPRRGEGIGERAAELTEPRPAHARDDDFDEIDFEDDESDYVPLEVDDDPE